MQVKLRVAVEVRGGQSVGEISGEGIILSLTCHGLGGSSGPPHVQPSADVRTDAGHGGRMSKSGSLAPVAAAGPSVKETQRGHFILINRDGLTTSD